MTRLERNGEFVRTLLRHLADCGAALGSFEPGSFPVVLQFHESVAKLRDTNFNLICAILEAQGVDYVTPDVLFVHSAFQEDRLMETPLGRTLHNLHSYGRSDREIAIVLAPEPDVTLDEWKSHFYAQTLVEQWGCSQSEARSRYIEEYGSSIEQLVSQVGDAIFPDNTRHMGELLASLLTDTLTASITITLLAHTDDEGGLCVAFPDGLESLDAFLWALEDLQRSGILPSASSLEFNVLACSYGVSGAEYTLGMLGSRLVLASPHSIGLLEASRFHDSVAAGMQEGLPLHEAYLRVIQEIIDQVRSTAPDLWDTLDFLWIPDLYSIDLDEEPTVEA